MKNTVCKYYLVNQCKYGSQCNFLHQKSLQTNKIKTVLSSYEDDQLTKKRVPIITPSTVIENKDILFELIALDLSLTTKNRCLKFIQGKCFDEDCPNYHGYSDSLLHISYIPCHTSSIISLCYINKEKFTSCDETSIKVWKIEDKLKCIGECAIPKGKIQKMISSNNKLFIPVIQSEAINENIMIYTLIESSLTSKISSMEVINDLIYFENMLICFGNDSIEFYKIVNKELMFLRHLSISNEITSVTYVNLCVFCGHLNGEITILKYDASDFFKQLSNFKAHNEKINRMLVKTVNDFSNYLITCSDDKSIKVFNIEKGMCVVFSRLYSFAIDNLFITTDEEGNELFCLCFKNGLMGILNNEFETMFEISAHGNNVSLNILS